MFRSISKYFFYKNLSEKNEFLVDFWIDSFLKHFFVWPRVGRGLSRTKFKS